MKKSMFLMLFAVICGATTTLKAQESVRTLPDYCRNEFRIGVGDNLTDLFFSGWSPTEKRNAYVLPNIFVDYTHHFCHWFGLGLQVNTIWAGGDMRERNEGAEWQSYLYGGLSVMPSLRFTYFRAEKNNVALYSSVYGGYCLGIDKSADKQQCHHGFTAGATLLGVSFGGEHWFGATELGGLFGSAAGTQIGSRIISIAVGYRF